VRHACAAGLKPSAAVTKATFVACSLHGNEFRQQYPEAIGYMDEGHLRGLV
jgi:hypothetical protein